MLVVRWLTCLFVVGCGRVDFDVQSHATTDGAPTGDSPNGPPDAACTWSTWGAPTHLTALESVADDWDGTQIGGLIVFTSDRATGERLFLGMSDNTFIRELTELNGSAMFTAGPTRSPDGSLLYFGQQDAGGYHLYQSAISGQTFGAPVAVAGFAGVNADSAAIAYDDLEMFFDDAQDNQISGHIYRATRADKTDPWIPETTPVVELASSKRDGWPSLSPDALTIWFESERAPKPGESSQIYTATRPDRMSKFSTPVAVTELDDMTSGDPDIDTTGTRMLYAHAMDSSGLSDLYLATRTCQ
jgi:hypothetical protein